MMIFVGSVKNMEKPDRNIVRWRYEKQSGQYWVWDIATVGAAKVISLCLVVKYCYYVAEKTLDKNNCKM